MATKFTKFFAALAAFSLLTTVAPNAHAELLVEPYLGYHTGEWESGTSGEDMKGPTYGARLGYQGMGFMAGIDYMMGMWEDESNPKNDVTPSDLGIFVGYNFPVMMRIYGVFSPDPLNPSLKFKSNGSSAKYEGSTMKVGIGFTALPMVSINAEYIIGTYDEVNGNNLTTDLKTKMLGVTVSLPLTF